ncbi:MAG: exosortase O [Leptolyngbyaceae cyanobacterium SM1_3_5]|nr:exosortase O [Leptolyngbyaceae cyanobacterium SM1_3_5]
MLRCCRSCDRSTRKSIAPNPTASFIEASSNSPGIDKTQLEESASGRSGVFGRSVGSPTYRHPFRALYADRFGSVIQEKQHMTVGSRSRLEAEVRSPLERLDRNAVGCSLAIALSWLYLNRSALQWVGQAIREVSIAQALMLAAGGLLLIVVMRRRIDRAVFGYARFDRAPLGLMLGCGLGAIATQWWISLEQIPVLFFVLGTYGWIGLHLDAIAWRRGLVVAVAIACIFPFGVQFSTGLGFPVRILTAHAIEWIFHHFQIAALSSEDIIILDTGLTRVDLPCSGLKSLWTGTLFLLLATWLEGRQIGGRWLLVCAANVGLLVIANLARVFTLVFVLQVLQQPAIAQTLHIPLGVVGFVTVCAIVWLLLRWVPRHSSKVAPPASNPPARSRLAALSAIACLLLMMLIPVPAAVTRSIDLAHLPFPDSMQTEAIALSPLEQQFFAGNPGTTVQKQRFEFAGLNGDLLLVASSSWQAHHAPELCLLSSGFAVSQMQQQQLTPDVLGRWMAIDNRQSALYWFQSPHRTTDDYLDRIWGEVSRQDADWVLVSILLDTPESPDRPAVRSLVDALHGSIAQQLRS